MSLPPNVFGRIAAHLRADGRCRAALARELSAASLPAALEPMRAALLHRLDQLVREEIGADGLATLCDRSASTLTAFTDRLARPVAPTGGK